MSNYPDRVSADLAKHERDEREAHLDYLDGRGARLYEALEQIHSVAGLEKLLDDQSLAIPLCSCFNNLEGAAEELASVFGRAKMPHVEAILTAVSRMEKTCVGWALGD